MSTDRELDIVFEDPDFVVVDKPSGLLSVPGRGPDKRDCVAARVRARYPRCIEQPAVHRDRLPGDRELGVDIEGIPRGLE